MSEINDVVLNIVQSGTCIPNLVERWIFLVQFSREKPTHASLHLKFLGNNAARSGGNSG